MRPQTTSPEVVAHERAIVAGLVGVAVDEVTFDDGGWDSRVYLVNRGQYVVKFPREGAARSYADEIAVLAALASVELPVLLPTVRWVEERFYGYAGIVGRQLSAVTESLTSAQARRIGTVIGEFLRVLHVQEIDVPVTSVEAELAEYAEKFAIARPELTARCTPDEVSELAEFFGADLPDRLKRLGEERACCHADLGPWNVIVTDDGNVGIIDFGDAAYRDPSIDFVALAPDVQEAALTSYGASDLLREKVAVRTRAFAVADLPFYIGKKDQAGLNEAMARVRRTFFG